MKWYAYVGMGLGLIWFFCMLARASAMWMDTRIFWRSLKAMQYQGSKTYLTIVRFVIPGLLGAPVMLWMDGLDAMRVTAAASIHQVAMELCHQYGPEQPFPEPELTEEEEHQQALTGYKPHPYFGALSSEDEVRENVTRIQ